jgi:acid phosphatase
MKLFAYSLSLLLIFLLPTTTIGTLASSSDTTSNTLDISDSATRMSNSTSHASSNQPSISSPLDVERYPVAPDNLELEQVQIFVRHGERTPVGIRLSSPPASIPEHWLLCKTASRLRAAISSGLVAGGTNNTDSTSAAASLAVNGGGTGQELLDILNPRVVERADGTKQEGECLLGELTDVGRQSTYRYGQSLRAIYIDKLGFLPDTLQRSNDVYFRSTNMPRTIESLQQVIQGLYPTTKCNPASIPPLFIRNGKDETLLGNTYACKRLELLLLGFAKAAASAYNPTLESLDKKLAKYNDGEPIRVDGRPRASGILDTIRAAVAHGIKIPSEFEDKAIVDVIERAVVNEWFAGYKTEEVRRLGMGRLLEDVSKRFQLAASQAHSTCSRTTTTGGHDEEASVPKILVHSTHDTTLAGLCSTLDVFDEKWPEFTASITFELFRQKQELKTKSYLQSFMSPFSSSRTPSQFYVRMRYQNRSLPLPFCSAEGKHLEGSPEFCTLEAFKERVKELTPVDWEKECSPAGRQ